MFVPYEATKFAENYLNLTSDDYVVKYFRDFENPRLHGYCDIDKFEIWINLAAKDLHIANTFFHEMVHIRQSKLKQLEYKGQLNFWKGTPFWPKANKVALRDKEFDTYYYSPWEIQARRISNNMIKKFIKTNVQIFPGWFQYV